MSAHSPRVSSNTADMSDLEVDIILMSLQLDPELPPPAQCWLLLSLLTSPELDTVDTARSSWPRSTPRKEHRSFLVEQLLAAGTAGTPRNFWRFFLLPEPRPSTRVSAAALVRPCITRMSLGGGPLPSTGSTPTPRWWNRFFLLLGNIFEQVAR